MVTQLNPAIPFYSIKHECECWAHAIIDYGPESYLYFMIILDDSGEIWVLDNTQLRGCTNYTIQRNSINKEPKSIYIDKFKEDGGTKK